MPATSAMQGAYLPQYTHMQTAAVPVEVGIEHPSDHCHKNRTTQKKTYQMCCQGIIAHACCSGTREIGARGSMSSGQLGLYS